MQRSAAGVLARAVGTLSGALLIRGPLALSSGGPGSAVHR